jgi:LAO/AO transport system kinase
MPPIVPTIATEADGITRLFEEISKHREYLRQTGAAEERVRRRLQHEVTQIAREDFDRWLSAWEQQSVNAPIFDRLVARDDDPGSVADGLLAGYRASGGERSG